MKPRPRFWTADYALPAPVEEVEESNWAGTVGKDTLLSSATCGSSHLLFSPLALGLHLLGALCDQRRVKRLDPARIPPFRPPAERDVEVTHRLVVFLCLPVCHRSYHLPFGLDLLFVDSAIQRLQHIAIPPDF